MDTNRQVIEVLRGEFRVLNDLTTTLHVAGLESCIGIALMKLPLQVNKPFPKRGLMHFYYDGSHDPTKSKDFDQNRELLDRFAGEFTPSNSVIFMSYIPFRLEADGRYHHPLCELLDPLIKKTGFRSVIHDGTREYQADKTERVKPIAFKEVALHPDKLFRIYRDTSGKWSNQRDYIVPVSR